MKGTPFSKLRASSTLPTRSPQSILQRPVSPPGGSVGPRYSCRAGASGNGSGTERESVSGSSAVETPRNGKGESHDPSADGGVVSGLVSRLPAANELSLFLVAALWGSNPACLRFVYQLEVPPSPASLAAIQASLAAVLLTIASIPGLLRPSEPQLHSNAAGSHGEAESPRGAGRQARQPGLAVLGADTVGRAGAELGCWTFLANAATITAFQHTPASRGAFLIRLTAVTTPVVSRALGLEVVKREWIACGAALLGGLFITLDTALADNTAATDAALGPGDALMVVSAFLWSVQTVRLGRHAKRHEQFGLARNQTAMFALLSLGWLALVWATADAGAPPTGSLLSQGMPPLVWAAVLWPALGPWGLATILQVRAQKTVSPSRTQVIMATDPLWATAFAALVAGEQGLGGLGWLGAACILSGSVISRH